MLTPENNIETERIEAAKVSKPSFERVVSHERAREAAQRLINSHFNNNRETYPHARCTIPVQPDDDDIVICDYITQQANKMTPLIDECIKAVCYRCQRGDPLTATGDEHFSVVTEHYSGEKQYFNFRPCPAAPLRRLK